jgi:hypothetical protein
MNNETKSSKLKTVITYVLSIALIILTIIVFLKPSWIGLNSSIGDHNLGDGIPEVDEKICAQVTTVIRNKVSGEVKEIPNSCIPEGWEISR